MLEYKTIGACSIKRKKPWKGVVWAGIENESVLLVDKSRCSLLYMKDGKTQKNISPIQNYVQNTRVICVTSTGSHVYGLTISGDVFIWEKDSGKLYLIEGHSALKSTSDAQEKVHINLSSDLNILFVSINCSRIFVWRKSTQCLPMPTRKFSTLPGHWYRVDGIGSVQLPEYYCKESHCESVFLNQHVLGECFLCSSIFLDTGGHTRLSTLLLSFNTDIRINSLKPQANWSTLEIPALGSTGVPARSRGALLVKYSNSMSLCALAINHQQVCDSRLVFVNPLTEAAVNADLSSLGAARERVGRHYWISSMAWSHDDALVYIITKLGTVAAVSRLGEPLSISTQGHGVNFASERFLPLLPRVSIRSKAQENVPPSEDTSQMSELSVMKQKYSVSRHPRLPLVIFSDGFQVIALQLVSSSNEKTLPLEFLSAAISGLRVVFKNQNFTDQTQQSRKRQRKLVEKEGTGVKEQSYRFEDKTFIDDDSSLISSLTDLDLNVKKSGDSMVVTFSTALPEKTTSIDPSNTKQAYSNIAKCLCSAWALLCSSTNWSHALENVAQALSSCVTRFLEARLKASLTAGRKLFGGALQQSTHLVLALLHLVKFDGFTQHMGPVSIKLVTNVIRLYLNMPEISSKQRIAGVKWSLILLQTCQHLLTRVYTWSPSLLANQTQHASRQTSSVSYEFVQPPYNSLLLRVNSDQDKDEDKDDNRETEEPHSSTFLKIKSSSLPSNRLLPIYRYITRALTDLYSRCHQKHASGRVLQAIVELISSCQMAVLPASRQLLSSQLPTIAQSDAVMFYLKGLRRLAVDEWAQAIDTSHGQKSSSRTRLLHAILYTQLVHGDIVSALQFTERIIQQASSHVPSQPTDNPNSLEVTIIGDVSVCKLVQSLARFMACYFTNSYLYVFPPHDPHPLPSLLHREYENMNGVVGIDRSMISRSVLQPHLAQIWTVQTCIRYMMLSGLYSELVSFTLRMGDWRTATGLSLAISQYNELSTSKNPKKTSIHSILPTELSATTLLSEAFSLLLDTNSTKDISSVPDKSTLIPSLRDAALAGALFNVPVLSNVVTRVWMQIKSLAANCSAFVPPDVYLPAPAMFLPQDVDLAQVDPDSDGYIELAHRLQLSSLIQKLLHLLSAAHLELPAAGWFLRQLNNCWKDETKTLAVTQVDMRMPETLSEYMTYQVTEKNKANRTILLVFRNMCSLLWMLHVRDMVSLHMHQAAVKLDSNNLTADPEDDCGVDRSWQSHIKTTIDWLLLYIPFSNFLSCQAEVCEAMVSLCEELPPSDYLASKMAAGIYDAAALAPEVNEKLTALLQAWQSISSETDEDKSLSLFYLECCQRTEHYLEARAKLMTFEEDVFSNPKATKVVGSRAHEYDIEFVSYLNDFFSVTIRKGLPERGVARPVPLVPSCSQTLQQLHFSKLQVVKIERQAGDSTERLEQPDLLISNTDDVLYSKDGNCGLFNSRRFKSHENLRASMRSGTSFRSMKRSRSMGSLREMPPLLEVNLAASDMLLPQAVGLNKKYQKLYAQYHWLEQWAGKSRGSTPTTNKPLTKIKIDGDELITAFMMSEKRVFLKQSGKPRPVFHLLRDMEPDLKDEEEQDRSRVNEELRRQALFPTATQPINQPELSQSTLSPNKTQNNNMEQTNRSVADEPPDTYGPIASSEAADQYLLDESATTVWSSATLPQLSMDRDTTEQTAAPTAETKDWRLSPDPGVLSPVSSRSRRSGRSLADNHTDAGLTEISDSTSLHLKSSGETSTWHTQSTHHSKQPLPTTKEKVRPRSSSQRQQHRDAPDHAAPQTGLVVTQLQNVIREEMRNILQLQHASVSHMLGALGGDAFNQMPQFTQSANKIDGRMQPNYFNQSTPKQSSHSALTMEDLAYSSRGDTSVKLPELFQEVQNLKSGRYKHPQANKHQPNSVKIPLLSIRPAWPAVHETRDQSQPDVEFPVASGHSMIDIRSERTPGRPLLHLHPESFSHQAPSVPLLHVHEPAADIRVGPEPAFSVQQLTEYDQKQTEKEKLKLKIMRRFADKAKQERAQAKKDDVERNLLRIDHSQLDVKPSAPAKSARRKGSSKSKSKRLQTASPTDLSKVPEQPIGPTVVNADTPKVDPEPGSESTPVVQAIGDNHQVTRVDVAPAQPNREDIMPVPEVPSEPPQQTYAIAPGMFDEYLDKAVELGDPLATYANAQYKAATGLQAKPPRLADVGVMTDMEQQIDPMEPLKARGQPIKSLGVPTLPPHIFSQLNFQSEVNDAATQWTHRGDGQTDREYISVIDVNDISGFQRLPITQGGADVQPPNNVPQIEEKQPDKSFAEVQYETAMGIAGRPGERAEVTEMTGAPDFITRELLAPRHEPADYIMPARRRLAFRDEAKQIMAERLFAMDDQLQAIEMMKENMEQQMKDTRLLVGAAQNAAENQAQVGMLRPAQVSQLIEMPEDETPGYVRVLRADEVTPDEELVSETQELPGEEEQELKSSSRMTVSGLSDINNVYDLVDNLLGQGDVNLEKLGVTSRTPRSPKKPTQAELRLSLEKVLTDRKGVTPRHGVLTERSTQRDAMIVGPTKHDPEEIKAWRKEHDKLTSQKYWEEKENLQKMETQPFIQTEKQLSRAEIAHETKQRESRRQEVLQEAYNRRLDAASHLLEGILEDHAVVVQKTKSDTRPSRSPATQRKTTTGGATYRDVATPRSTGGALRVARGRNPGDSGIYLPAKERRNLERIYGTKRIPGLYQGYQPENRTGKTNPQQGSIPPEPTATLSRTMQQVTQRGMKSHPPIHKPKTYAQQLQELQANAPKATHSTLAYTPCAGGPVRQRSPTQRGRPYPGAYYRDDASELSGLSDLELRRLVGSVLDDYNADITMDDDDISELSSLAAAGLAMMAAQDGDRRSDRGLIRGPSSGAPSEVSFIDWEYVDNLIADVSDTASRLSGL